MHDNHVKYVQRLADVELKNKLAAASTVLIGGPKACRKTATAVRVAKSKVNFDIDANAREARLIDPNLVLQGGNPRLFDEWQLVPNLESCSPRIGLAKAERSVHINGFSCTC